MRTVLMLAIGFMMASCATLRTGPDELAAQQQQINDDLTNGRYTVEVHRMNPLRSKSRALSSGYTLTVHGDSATAHLPFFGQATSMPYGGDSGISFADNMRDYRLTPNAKGDGWDAKFEVRGTNDVFTVYLTIYTNGRTHITVNSIHRDPIHYDGEIRLRKS